MAEAPVVCCDLDGVVWRGTDTVPGAAAAIEQLRAAGLRVGFVSNNSNDPIDAVVKRLGDHGIMANPEEVLTSALAAAGLLAGALPAGARVLACGGPGVHEALRDAGFTVVDRPPAAAVVVGLHRDFDFQRLALASEAVRSGARFIATNLDPTFPIPGGLLPGAGAIVAAVAAAGGRAPEVAGKPAPAMVDLVRSHLGASGVVVGDRPSTDGALAAALGWLFALVLSGVTGNPVPPGGEAVPTPPPPFVASDLGEVAPQLVAALQGTDRPGA